MSETVQISSDEAVEPQGEPQGLKDTGEPVQVSTDGEASEATQADPQPQGEESPQEERPEWLPEKFKTPEDLVQAYGELETKLGKQGQETSDTPTDEGGLDFTPYFNEYLEKGEISEDSYKALAGEGIPKQLVDTFVAGQQALQDQSMSAVYEVCGGKQEFERLCSWAGDNLTDGEIDAFNALANEPSKLALATRGLLRQYEEANGQKPMLTSVKKTTSKPSSSYTFDQFVKDAADPRYNDPLDSSFRDEVARKLKEANL